MLLQSGWSVCRSQGREKHWSCKESVALAPAVGHLKTGFSHHLLYLYFGWPLCCWLWICATGQNSLHSSIFLSSCSAEFPAISAFWKDTQLIIYTSGSEEELIMQIQFSLQVPKVSFHLLLLKISTWKKFWLNQIPNLCEGLETVIAEAT